MAENGLAVPAQWANVLSGFAASFEDSTPGKLMAVVRLPALRRFLVNPESHSTCHGPPPASGQVESEIAEWGRWQRDLAGISKRVVDFRARWVRGLLTLLDNGEAVVWGDLNPRLINEFIAERGAGYATASYSLLVSAVRALLKWALAEGRVDRDLSPGILKAKATRATLPKGLTSAQMEALLATGNKNLVAEARDRAVITTLARLGLRAGEAATLTLDDINWDSGHLTVVAAKTQRRLVLPVPPDVGEALVAWLRLRPNAEDRALFTRLRAPIRALTAQGVSGIVKHVAERAGLGVIHAHRLRHTAAMNVIAAGGSLNEARELLGHATIESTYVYARTDLESLRTLTVPFGRVPQ
ncbi:MAG: tyrosine-type recombinase/integrase [Promicromonosporaceae bacterium]|nr:tyrosine-type recombinase/integrase [Promicromonosporaceae bacterium]